MPSSGPYPTGDQSSDLFATVVSFLQADSPAATRHVVELNQNLLAPAAVDILRELAAAQPDVHVRNFVFARVALLDLCRRIGIHGAFAELEGPVVDRSLGGELQVILAELEQPVTVDGTSRRVELCRRALILIDRNREPQIWAAVQAELGDSLANSSGPGRADSLNQAIQAYESALHVFTRQATAGEWLARTYTWLTLIGGEFKETGRKT